MSDAPAFRRTAAVMRNRRHVADRGDRKAGRLQRAPAGWVSGRMTGAEALVETLIQEGTACVFGIPGAQENELWDEFKARGVPYLLTAFEFGAACMADGYARVTNGIGICSVHQGPGLTNTMTGLTEAAKSRTPLLLLAADTPAAALRSNFRIDQHALGFHLRIFLRDFVEDLVPHHHAVTLCVRLGN